MVQSIIEDLSIYVIGILQAITIKNPSEIEESAHHDFKMWYAKSTIKIQFFYFYCL